MLTAPPNISSGVITTENGRFVLEGNPTPHDVEVFEKWRNEVEAIEQESEDEPLS